MISGRSREFAVFISIAGLSTTVAVVAAIVANLEYGYSSLVIFSVVVTLEALILGVYQTIFVDRIIHAKFITGDVEEFARYLRLASEVIKDQADELEEIDETIAELIDEMEDIDEVEVESWDLNDELDEKIKKNFEEITGKDVEEVIPRKK